MDDTCVKGYSGCSRFLNDQMMLPCISTFGKPENPENPEQPEPLVIASQIMAIDGKHQLYNHDLCVVGI